ncbi:tRNA 2-selenouridine(34) synthase MnmH [Sulfurimonas sp. MAG313]|nr:tRNA 2-selenouridine(34) synthase MnmH [Sulfurimonas sp. MAG313]MDF1879887.1 tRNA 2-selenouridine(34) synthase MnmH [Sulfurimonas sp. MAG313]
MKFTEDFLSIVLENRPLLDVRAPVEYDKGSFPNATNIAIMDDEQRRLIGIRYKEEGNASAVKLGRELVNEEEQVQRIKDWKIFIQNNPNAYLYCFRGGQRSEITQMWLEEAGIEIARLKGGYKAFRNFLTQESETITSTISTIIVGGRTGSGKTILLQELDNMIDLEGLAKHRGSTFGKVIDEQPSQVDFEDALYYKLIQHKANGHKHLVIEHEGNRIGRVHLPKTVHDDFSKGGLVILQTSIDERIEITYDEYVTLSLESYAKVYGLDARAKWYEEVVGGLDRIKRRLGSQAHLEIRAQCLDAYESGNDTGHKVWIKRLLHDYYDPMYDYQIEKTDIPILFRGNKSEVLEFIKNKG